MDRLKTLSLPVEFPYLVHKKMYRVLQITDDTITVARSKGQIVEIPITVMFRCYNDLIASPERMCPLQEILQDSRDSFSFGESIIGAVLVAAGLARVAHRNPVCLAAVCEDS